MSSSKNPGGFAGWLRKNKIRLRNAAIAAAVAGTGVAVWYGVGLYQQRKATEAMIEERHQQTQQNQTATAEAAEEGLMPVMGDTVTWQGKTYKRNSYVKAILCMGVDREGSMQEPTLSGDGGQSDGLFLLAQDTARNSLKILMIPRDSMAEITQTDTSWTDKNGTVLGTITDQLTLAYSYGDGKETSCEYTVQAVSNLLGGLRIDSYLAADTDVISILNDAVGGVTVTIPTAGMEQKDPAFVLGDTVTLHGDQAEAFVRFRDIDKDNTAISRMEQQKAYINGFFAAVREASRTNSRIVEDLFELIQEYMVTDMTKAEYLKMAMDGLNGEGITSSSYRIVPGVGTATTAEDEYYVDKEAVIPVLLELFYREV